MRWRPSASVSWDQLLPRIRLIGALLNPSFPPAVRQLRDIEDATRSTGQKLFVAKASNDAELNTAFLSLVQQQVGAVLVAADPYSIHGATGSLRLRPRLDFRPSTSFANLPLRAG